jgi:predicted Zn-dependent protease
MKSKHMKKIIPILYFSLILFSVSCAVNPVTGKRELSLISEEGEISLGKETDAQIREQYGIYDDPALLTYMQGVGQTMTLHTHRPRLTYHFAVLDTPVVNAFAVPGGYIYITRGILALMSSEAELAVVLGHELGHVNARHSVAKLSQLILVQVGLAVGGAISETFAKITGVASLGIQLLFLKFSRDDEREADALGVEYSRKGGYNPGEMVSFFASLEGLGDLSEGHSLPGFLSTHPLTAERIQNTKAMLAESDQQLKTEQNAYFGAIQNMVYGEDPRQGYVEKNAFYHPQLRFSFSIPQEWNVQNTPSKVALASKDGLAAVVLQAEKSSEDLQDYASKKASKIEGGQLLNEKSFKINGLASHHQVYDVSQQEEEDLRMRLSFIGKNGFIYTFIALSTRSDFDKYDRQFQSVVGSFNELRDTRYLNRKPKRIHLVKANGRENLQEMFRKAGMAEDLWPRFAIMNGLELNQVPKSGQPIKIVR